jgi:hypothetical protein
MEQFTKPHVLPPHKLSFYYTYYLKQTNAFYY